MLVQRSQWESIRLPEILRPGSTSRSRSSKVQPNILHGATHDVKEEFLQYLGLSSWVWTSHKALKDIRTDYLEYVRTGSLSSSHIVARDA